MALMLPVCQGRGLDIKDRVGLPVMYNYVRYMDDMDDITGLFDSPLRRMQRFEHGLGQFEDMFHGDPTRGMENPYVTDESGERKLKLEYDVRGYKPEEIHVKTKDNRLVVEGKHVEEEQGRRAHSEFTRVFDLPEGMDVTQLKSRLSKGGVLYIEGPAPQGTPVPVQQEQ